MSNITCRRCGLEKPQSTRDKGLCVDCVKAENSRITYYRQHQDWITAANEQGILLWLQQPGETQWEYTIWTKYRDSYPGKKPTYASVAAELGTTYNVVNKVAQRWSFQLRMQAWMAECDRITMLQRHDEILGMNREHIEMASSIREKLKAAIDILDPQELRPSEIVSLAKLSAEMERKARLDTMEQEEARHPLLVDTDNPNLKKTETKKDNLQEVVNILVKAGALGDITHIGVRQTTEVALVDKDGQSASVLMEES